MGERERERFDKSRIKREKRGLVRKNKKGFRESDDSKRMENVNVLSKERETKMEKRKEAQLLSIALQCLTPLSCSQNRMTGRKRVRMHQMSEFRGF